MTRLDKAVVVQRGVKPRSGGVLSDCPSHELLHCTRSKAHNFNFRKDDANWGAKYALQQRTAEATTCCISAFRPLSACTRLGIKRVLQMTARCAKERRGGGCHSPTSVSECCWRQNTDFTEMGLIRHVPEHLHMYVRIRDAVMYIYGGLARAHRRRTNGA